MGTRFGLPSKTVTTTDRVRSWMIPIVALCGTLCLTSSAALAQSLAARDGASETITVRMGWQPPERKILMLPAANSQLGMPALTKRDIAASPASSTREPNNDRLAEFINRASLDPGGFGPAVTARNPELTYLADGELPSSRSLLALFQAKYAGWESSLADTSSLASVEGLFVYPLLQVNYGGWRLPVALYIPPLRGSDARR